MQTREPLLPIRRAEEIQRRLQRIFSSESVRIVVVPQDNATNRYFPSDLEEALSRLRLPGRPAIRFTSNLSEAIGAQILLATSHAHDLSTACWTMRLDGFDGVIATWHWDNHHSPVANLSCVLGADVVFPAHSPFASALNNPVSIRAPTLPLSLSQWSRAQADRLFAAYANGPRKDALAGGFVEYPGSSRHDILTRLVREMPEADLTIMAKSNREPYFAKTAEQRFEWWAASKVSIMLPVHHDLSMRMFDALIAGQTLIAPRDVPDLDVIVPPAYQSKLGIVRFGSADAPSIRDAHRQALAIFDRDGEAGIRLRHRFVRESHMIEDRLAEAVRRLRQIADGGLKVSFIDDKDYRCGLVASAA